jgi:hypothetical protein
MTHEQPSKKQREKVEHMKANLIPKEKPQKSGNHRRVYEVIRRGALNSGVIAFTKAAQKTEFA